MANKIPVADRFVHAKHDDWGNRQAPALGFVVHMAEGLNVWRYLAYGNVARNVSVHFTVEADGEIVQMLELQRISGSINPSTIRRDDDANGHFGASHNKYVLGSWWTNPNHATITVEVAGYNRTGPNEKQVEALDKLFTALRKKYPSIKPLGHRDFQNVKPCPGQKMWYKAYPAMGGHGKDFKARDMDEPSGGDAEGKDKMIFITDNITRTSTHYLEVEDGTEVFDAPDGELVRKIREARKFDYFGFSGNWRAIEVQIPADNTEQPPRKAIAYVRKTDAQVIGKYPDPVGPTDPEQPQQSDRELALEAALQDIAPIADTITVASNEIAQIADDLLA